MVVFTCSKCGKRLQVSKGHSGRQARCPACGATVSVPAKSSDIDEVAKQLYGERAGLNDLAAAVRMQRETAQAKTDQAAHKVERSPISAPNLFPCPDCGHQVSRNAAACPSCGRPMGQPSASPPPGHATSAAPQQNAPGATGSLVCGILGFFCAGLIFGLIAIALASQANKAIAQDPGRYSGKDTATAGMVLGIIDIVLWAIVIFSFAGAL